MKCLLLLLIAISLKAHNLIEIQKINPNIQVCLVYATENNVAKQPLYPQDAKAYLRATVAHKLDRVARRLEQEGLGLKVFDAYRPLFVQRALWHAFPDERYVSNPDKNTKSVHCRGAAVDVTLIDLATGNELTMPTAFDDFSERAWSDCINLDSEVIIHRKKLQEVMLAEGFLTIESEWWHFNDADWQSYQVLDISFKELDKS